MVKEQKRVHRPTRDALKTIKDAARKPIGPDNPHNAFLVSRDTGEIVTSLYLSQGARIEPRPENAYLIDIRPAEHHGLDWIIDYSIETGDLQLERDLEIEKEDRETNRWKESVLHTVWEAWGRAKADCEDGNYSDERLIEVFKNTMLPDKLTPIAFYLRDNGWLDKDEPPEYEDIDEKEFLSYPVKDEIDRAVSE